MTKQAIREQSLAFRKALSLTEVENRSQQVAERFLQWLSTNDRLATTATIHVFLPIQRRREIDTWPIIRALWQRNPSVQVVASITNFDNYSLRHYLLTEATVLINNKWGIPEPVAEEQYAVADSQLDMVLVPLLGFDQWGQRVGYGGGFYDRFLANCRSNCFKIGLSLFGPIVQSIDAEPTDVKLDQCVTPTQIWQFST